MNPQEFQDFKVQLAHNVEAHSDLLGLVFLGSSSDSSRQDQWSDHDFFLIAREGFEEHIRQDLSWLPADFEVALAFRDTDHGLQAISKEGHLLEFAVFSEHELYLYGRANAYTVMSDKSSVTEIMKHSARAQTPQQKDVQYHVGKVLACAIICMGRYARGERASGREVFLNGVLRSFLYLYKNAPVAEGAPAHHRMDNLDVFRRVETSHPELGDLLDRLEPLPVPLALQKVLEVQMERVGQQAWYPTEAHQAVVKKLEQAL